MHLFSTAYSSFFIDFKRANPWKDADELNCLPSRFSLEQAPLLSYLNFVQVSVHEQKIRRIYSSCMNIINEDKLSTYCTKLLTCSGYMYGTYICPADKERCISKEIQRNIFVYLLKQKNALEYNKEILGDFFLFMYIKRKIILKKYREI